MNDTSRMTLGEEVAHKIERAQRAARLRRCCHYVQVVGVHVAMTSARPTEGAFYAIRPDGSVWMDA